jgi:ribosomal protein S18 acetylase RimI-like enzyme
MFKGEAMIGACNLTKYKPYYTISNFGVVKSQRRYGYGKIMFEYVLKHQKDTVWKVRVSNTPVRRFYEKFGSKIFKSSIDGEFLYYGCI